MQIIIPMICLAVMVSLNKNAPTKTNTTAKVQFAIRGALLTSPPALYAKIQPSSKPMITTPSAREVQFSFLISSVIFAEWLPIRKIANEIIAETPYVTASDKIAFALVGVFFETI